MDNLREVKLNYIFGPVPSRRLGFSLGVDIVPFKTCTLDCVYCQLGRTTRKTVKRGGFVTPKDILHELSYVLDQRQSIDYITFSGSGEPTLNSNIGEIIKTVKGITDTPVAVITNGTLLYQKGVRNALRNADLVIPSLDAVTQEVFERINRPHGSLEVDRIIDGLKSFSREFNGEIWLEIMFVKGQNDHLDEVEKIKTMVSEIDPKKIQLNTVVRPPAESSAEGLSVEELQAIETILGEKYSVIEEFQKKEQDTNETDIKSAILNLVRRRSVTLPDISSSLGIHMNEAIKYLNDLQKQKIIKIIVHDGQDYYMQMDEFQEGSH
ncbi:MAG: radical SAM protein [Deltaproteobacteria bacterium CG_4_9_14_3_um_filter_44_9]|nr:MAG: radical SAM protein [Deltaproteobacteria bacterium CG_4_9_14_3_um_filter_44_9]